MEDYERYQANPESDQSIQTMPETEVVESKPSFWQRNGATIITLAILGLIVGGAIAVNERRTGDDLAIEDDSIVMEDDNNENDGDVIVTDDTPEQPAEPIQPAAPAEPQIAGGDQVTASGETATVVAERGDGRTHLARKAITEHLRQTNTDLSDEQRVYAEDHLQKKYASHGSLDIGESISFSMDDVNESISASQNLNSAQIENLHQYSVLVNWPPI